MKSEAEFLNASAAARMLGISAKALRIYERQGLVEPVRTTAGWRAYGPAEMARAREVAALRALGLSLAQVARVLDGDATHLEAALASQQAALEHRIGELAETVAKVRSMRTELAKGASPAASDLQGLVGEATVAFELPWPWGGERFILREIRPLNYLTGPLGSGKTRLALRLAEALPDAAFLDLNRAADGAAAARAQLGADRALALRMDQALAWLAEDGAETTDDLIALVVEFVAERRTTLVVDLVEQGLNEATQAALMAYLRRRGPAARPLFLMTRSNAILDLAAVGPDELIIYCPANHSPPIHVTPFPGAPGYEAVASCLASPEVRARTEGMRAVMTQAH